MKICLTFFLICIPLVLCGKLERLYRVPLREMTPAEQQELDDLMRKILTRTGKISRSMPTEEEVEDLDVEIVIPRAVLRGGSVHRQPQPSTSPNPWNPYDQMENHQYDDGRPILVTQPTQPSTVDPKLIAVLNQINSRYKTQSTPTQSPVTTTRKLHIFQPATFQPFTFQPFTFKPIQFGNRRSTTEEISDDDEDCTGVKRLFKMSCLAN